jgi:hypothetical protein
VKDTEKAQQSLKMLQDSHAECQNGAAVRLAKKVVVAKKPEEGTMNEKKRSCDHERDGENHEDRAPKKLNGSVA